MGFCLRSCTFLATLLLVSAASPIDRSHDGRGLQPLQDLAASLKEVDSLITESKDEDEDVEPSGALVDATVGGAVFAKGSDGGSGRSHEYCLSIDWQPYPFLHVKFFPYVKVQAGPQKECFNNKKCREMDVTGTFAVALGISLGFSIDIAITGSVNLKGDVVIVGAKEETITMTNPNTVKNLPKDDSFPYMESMGLASRMLRIWILRSIPTCLKKLSSAGRKQLKLQILLHEWKLEVTSSEFSRETSFNMIQRYDAIQKTDCEALCNVNEHSKCTGKVPANNEVCLLACSVKVADGKATTKCEKKALTLFPASRGAKGLLGQQLKMIQHAKEDTLQSQRLRCADCDDPSKSQNAVTNTFWKWMTGIRCPDECPGSFFSSPKMQACAVSKTKSDCDKTMERKGDALVYMTCQWEEGIGEPGVCSDHHLCMPRSQNEATRLAAKKWEAGQAYCKNLKKLFADPSFFEVGFSHHDVITAIQDLLYFRTVLLPIKTFLLPKSPILDVHKRLMEDPTSVHNCNLPEQEREINGVDFPANNVMMCHILARIAADLTNGKDFSKRPIWMLDNVGKTNQESSIVDVEAIRQMQPTEAAAFWAQLPRGAMASSPTTKLTDAEGNAMPWTGGILQQIPQQTLALLPNSVFNGLQLMHRVGELPKLITAIVGAYTIEIMSAQFKLAVKGKKFYIEALQENGDELSYGDPHMLHLNKAAMKTANGKDKDARAQITKEAAAKTKTDGFRFETDPASSGGADGKLFTLLANNAGLDENWRLRIMSREGRFTSDKQYGEVLVGLEAIAPSLVRTLRDSKASQKEKDDALAALAKGVQGPVMLTEGQCQHECQLMVKITYVALADKVKMKNVVNNQPNSQLAIYGTELLAGALQGKRPTINGIAFSPYEVRAPVASDNSGNCASRCQKQVTKASTTVSDDMKKDVESVFFFGACFIEGVMESCYGGLSFDVIIEVAEGYEKQAKAKAEEAEKKFTAAMAAYPDPEILEVTASLSLGVSMALPAGPVGPYGGWNLCTPDENGLQLTLAFEKTYKSFPTGNQRQGDVQATYSVEIVFVWPAPIKIVLRLHADISLSEPCLTIFCKIGVTLEIFAPDGGAFAQVGFDIAVRLAEIIYGQVKTYQANKAKGETDNAEAAKGLGDQLRKTLPWTIDLLKKALPAMIVQGGLTLLASKVGWNSDAGIGVMILPRTAIQLLFDFSAIKVGAPAPIQININFDSTMMYGAAFQAGPVNVGFWYTTGTQYDLLDATKLQTLEDKLKVEEDDKEAALVLAGANAPAIDVPFRPETGVCKECMDQHEEFRTTGQFRSCADQEPEDQLVCKQVQAYLAVSVGMVAKKKKFDPAQLGKLMTAEYLSRYGMKPTGPDLATWKKNKVLKASLDTVFDQKFAQEDDRNYAEATAKMLTDPNNANVFLANRFARNTPANDEICRDLISVCYMQATESPKGDETNAAVAEARKEGATPPVITAK